MGSGQAAVAVALLGLLGAGDHLVSAASIYEGWRWLFADNFARLGIASDFVIDANDPAVWERAIRPSTRGVETLSLRVERQSANALTVAQWLERQPEVASVDHAGLESSPYRDLARRYLPRGQGSVFAFSLHGGEAAARTVINAVGLFTRMTHLGDVRSLILHPGTTTHTLRTAEDLRRAGISPGLVRLSIGIEDTADLPADLDQAFAALRAAEPGRVSRVPVTAGTLPAWPSGAVPVVTAVPVDAAVAVARR